MLPLSAALPVLNASIMSAYETATSMALEGESTENVTDFLGNSLADAISVYLSQGQVIALAGAKTGAIRTLPPGKLMHPMIAPSFGITQVDPAAIPVLASELTDALIITKTVGAESSASPEKIDSDQAQQFADAIKNFVDTVHIMEGGITIPFMVNLMFPAGVLTPPIVATPATMIPEIFIGTTRIFGTRFAGIVNTAAGVPVLKAALEAAFNLRTSSGAQTGISHTAVNATLASQMSVAIHAYLATTTTKVGVATAGISFSVVPSLVGVPPAAVPTPCKTLPAPTYGTSIGKVI